MRHFHSFMLSLILVGILTICLVSYANGKTIYGCYKKNGGLLRIVDEGSGCSPSEVSISWDQSDSRNGPSVIVRQMTPGSCIGDYGWCPDGFTWVFDILDSAVNGSSVVAINIANPYLFDYGCEVATKAVGEFRVICIGNDYVGSETILQYAVFNP